MEWFESAREIASAYGLTDRRTDLDRAGRRHSESGGFRGVVLGGPRRGKTTLLERLKRDGEDGEDGDHREGEGIAGELVELPGLSRPSGLSVQGGARRTASEQDALLRADVAVLVIAATASLSMDEERELRFLRDTVGVPRVVVAVSRTDQVEPDERDELLDDIRDRVTAACRDVPVFLTSTTADGGTPSVAELRRQLGRYRADPRLPALRKRRLARQTCAVLDDMIGFGGTAAAARERTEHDRTAARESLRDVLGERDARVRGLQVGLEERGLATARDIYVTAQQRRRALARDLRQQLSAAQEPLAWWRSEFDDQLQTRLTDVCEPWARRLQDEMAATIRQLEESLAEFFPTAFGGIPERLARPYPASAGGRPFVRLPDVERLRRLAGLVQPGVEFLDKVVTFVRERRQDAGGAGGSGDGLHRIVADVVAAAASELADHHLAKEEARQRRVLADQVTRVVHREVETVAEGLDTMVRAAYAALGRELDTARRTWLLAEERALAAAAAGLVPGADPGAEVEAEAEAEPDWEELVRRATALRRKIEAGTDIGFGTAAGTGKGIDTGGPA
ncbi:GTPase domain-containing protein [Streptomyces sp. NPDC051366]|uniref:GTPase domain-containing protein n=1 Tax=Streptomyces sp. NPDC051366 TaxID=3365652 RepID=UPI00378CA7D7